MVQYILLSARPFYVIPLCFKFLEDFSTETIVINEMDFSCGTYNRFLPFSIHVLLTLRTGAQVAQLSIQKAKIGKVVPNLFCSRATPPRNR
jgi:hypothetical protein